MSAAAVAAEFAALSAAGDHEGTKKFWADDVVSVEATPDEPFALCRGRAEVEAKHATWAERVTSHSIEFEGPFLHGDRFFAVFEVDCTVEGLGRHQGRELALFTVKDGQIVEERFFQNAGQIPAT